MFHFILQFLTVVEMHVQILKIILRECSSDKGTGLDITCQCRHKRCSVYILRIFLYTCIGNFSLNTALKQSKQYYKKN